MAHSEHCPRTEAVEAGGDVAEQTPPVSARVTLQDDLTGSAFRLTVYVGWPLRPYLAPTVPPRSSREAKRDASEPGEDVDLLRVPAAQARIRRDGYSCAHLLASAFAVAAPRPAARSTLALLKLLLGPANAALSGHLLLGILDPADELVAGQRRDVLPGIERLWVGDQSFAQVFRKLVHHPTGHSSAVHKTTVASCSGAGASVCRLPVRLPR
jgi:hypothetical protein